MTERPIVAVAPLTQAELELLGKNFHRTYRAIDTPCFEHLLAAVGEADRAMQLDEGRVAPPKKTRRGGRAQG